MDAPADSRRFAADYGIAFPLLSDEDGAVAGRYTGITSDRAGAPERASRAIRTAA